MTDKDTEAEGGEEAKPESFGDAMAKAWDEAAEGEAEAKPVEGEQEAAEEEQEAEEIVAPEHWSDQDKEAFNALPEELRPLYLDKVKAIEGGYNKKFEDLAKERKTLDRYRPFDDLFAPFQVELDRAGLTPDAYVRQLMATATQLRAKPKETLLELARIYGVNDLVNGQAEPALEDEFLDPAAAAKIRALEQQVTELQRNTTDNLNKLTQANNTASQQQMNDTWNAFSTASQEGKPLYPHAERLKQNVGWELARMAQSGETNGKPITDSLKIAYERAAWADESARQDMLKSREDLHRKAEVQKAKKAQRVVKSKSEAAPKAPSAAGSWKGGLEEAWDELAG